MKYAVKKPPEMLKYTGWLRLKNTPRFMNPTDILLHFGGFINSIWTHKRERK